MPKLINLVDQRFNNLTVKEAVGKDKKGNRLWLCECICGNTVITTSYLLMSGRKKNCGCKHKLNLTDQRFGDLVVKKSAGKDKHRNRLWLCECTCGNEVVTASYLLTSGQKTNCGCKSIRKQSLVNQKFGDLTVKKFTGRDKQGNRLWLCECTCGNTIITTSYFLRSGRKTHCGCKNKYRRFTVNQKFGNLTIKKVIGLNKYKNKILLCECVCGNTIEVTSFVLKLGLKTHCGCKNKQEVKQEMTKHIEKIQMVRTEHKTVRADYNVFKICDNDLTSFNKMEILDKKNLILKLTQKVLEEAKSSASLDLFLTFLTGRKSNLGYLY